MSVINNNSMNDNCFQRFGRMGSNFLLFLFPVVLLSPLSPSSTCSYRSIKSGMVLSCRALNSTASINEEVVNTTQPLVKVEILDSFLDCLQLQHFCRYPHLEEIKVRKSGLRKAVCSSNKQENATQCLKSLRSMDLSYNKLSRLGRGFSSLHHLERLDLSNNKLSQFDKIFSTFNSLKYLNLSNNLLSEKIHPHTLKTLPPSVEQLDLTRNLFTCYPSLSWLYPWSQTLSPSLHAQLDKVTCNVINSHQMSPLLQVMKYYTAEVSPSCPNKCLCYIYHFPATLDTTTSYTVLVNCTMQGFTTFPTLPLHTTILDISHNNISDMAYSSLKLSDQHYTDLSGLILSHNQLSSLHPKLSQLKLHRMFKVDNNNISSISHHLSLHLQSYPNNKISLGYNPWRCSCNAEITSLVIFDYW